MNAPLLGLDYPAQKVWVWFVFVITLCATAAEAADPRIRKNQADLSDAERDAFVKAVKKMKSDMKYDRYIGRHFQASPNAHRATSFIAWHRKFIWDFETDLLAADAALNGGTNILKGLPYWEWSDHEAKSPFTDNFMGGEGDPADGEIVKTGKFQNAGADPWITMGPKFKPDPADPTEMIPDLNADGTVKLEQLLDGKLLRSAFITNNQVPDLPTRGQVTAALGVTTYDSDPWNPTVAANKSFRNRLEGFVPVPPGLHNRVHVWVGGHMRIVPIAPNDPTFFLNHGEVDRIWAIWQVADANRRDSTKAESYPQGAGPPAGQRLDDEMDFSSFPGAAKVKPKQMIDIRGADLGYQYEVAAGWKKGTGGNWSEKAKWDIKDKWLLDQFPKNDDWLLWNVTLPAGELEIKQNEAPLTINSLNNIGSKFILEKEMTVKGGVVNGENATINAGKKLTIEGELKNSGKVVNKVNIQAKKFTNLKDTKLDPAVFEITGPDPDDVFDNLSTGVLEGTGMVIGSVRNHGLINPGSLDPADLTEVGPGVIDVVGNYDQFSDGRLMVDVTGPASLDHDRLAIDGPGNFDGELLIHFGGNYAPQANDLINGLITVSGARVGDFSPSNIRITGVQPGFSYAAGFDGSGSFNLQALSNATSSLPQLASSPGPGGSLGFGDVRIGDSVQMDVEISNVGDPGSLLKGSISEASGDLYSGLGSQFMLLQGESTRRPVTYSPTDHGPDNQSIDVRWEGTPQQIMLTGNGVGPTFDSSVMPGGDIDFGDVLPGASTSASLSVANRTTDSPTLDSLVGLTILDAFLSQNDHDHFSLSGFAPGTVLSKDELLSLDLEFMAHIHPVHPMEHEHDFFVDPPTTEGLKSAVLNIATDLNAPFGEIGDVFQFILVANVPILGDYNRDGVVDAADYVVWRKTDGSQAGYDLWRANFGRTAAAGATGSASGLVPEPATIVLLLLSACALVSRSRQNGAPAA